MYAAAEQMGSDKTKGPKTPSGSVLVHSKVQHRGFSCDVLDQTGTCPLGQPSASGCDEAPVNAGGRNSLKRFGPPSKMRSPALGR
jgi:hypothetical protein